MKNNKVFIIAFLTFVVAGTISFGLTKILRDTSSNTVDSEVVANQTAETGAKAPSQNEESKTAEEPSPSASASGTQVVDKAKMMEEEIARKEAEKDKKADMDKQKAQDAEAVKCQSYEELTAIINNRANSNYPRNISIRYTNLDPENEEAQTSIANIRNYIHTGIWKSVTVVGATYDKKTGKVTSLTLQINR